jgi:hypothetical protein
MRIEVKQKTGKLTMLRARIFVAHFSAEPGASNNIIEKHGGNSAKGT